MRLLIAAIFTAIMALSCGTRGIIVSKVIEPPQLLKKTQIVTQNISGAESYFKKEYTLADEKDYILIISRKGDFEDWYVEQREYSMYSIGEKVRPKKIGKRYDFNNREIDIKKQTSPPAGKTE